MKQGLYKHTKDDEYLDREKIIIEVSETAKLYIFELIINTFRYSPVHIDMMFAKSDRVIISKEKKPHAIILGNDYFIIYPYRAGIPFLFEYISD